MKDLQPGSAIFRVDGDLWLESEHAFVRLPVEHRMVAAIPETAILSDPEIDKIVAFASRDGSGTRANVVVDRAARTATVKHQGRLDFVGYELVMDLWKDHALEWYVCKRVLRAFFEGDFIAEIDFEQAIAPPASKAASAADTATASSRVPIRMRCPRCEMDTCRFGKPKVVTENPLVGLGFLYWAWPLAWVFGSKRWRCDSCGYAWDDPSAGPKTPTRLPEGMVRPTFRLRRGHLGTGVLVGGPVVILGAKLVGKLARAAGYTSLGIVVVIAIIGTVVGAVVGLIFKHDVCSTPECREPLSPGVSECPRCHRTIAGVVGSAAEHFIMAAQVRKDLVRLAEEEAEETPPTKARRGAKGGGKSTSAEGRATRSSTQ